MPSLGKLDNGCEYNILPSPLRRELAHKKNRSIGSNGSSSKKQHLSSSSSLKLRQNTSISYNPTVSRTNEVEEIDDSDDEGKKFFNISPRFSGSYFQPLDVDITVGNSPTNSDAPSDQCSKRKTRDYCNEQSVKHNAKRGCNRKNVAHNSPSKFTAGRDDGQHCEMKDAKQGEQCIDESSCNRNNEDIREEEIDNDIYVHKKSNAQTQQRDAITTAVSEEEISSPNTKEEWLGDVIKNDKDDKKMDDKMTSGQQQQNQRNTTMTSNNPDSMPSELSDIREMTYRLNECHIKYTVSRETEKRLLSEEKLVTILDIVLAIFCSDYCWDKVSRIVDRVIGWKDDGTISNWKDCLLGRTAFHQPSLVAILDTIDFSDEMESKYRVKMAFLLFLALNLHRRLSHNNGIIQRAGEIPDEVKTFFFGLFLSQMDNGGFYSSEPQKDTFNTFIFILFIIASGGKDMSVRKINHLWRDMNIDDDYASTLLRRVGFVVEKNGIDVNVSLPAPLKLR